MAYEITIDAAGQDYPRPALYPLGTRPNDRKNWQIFTFFAPSFAAKVCSPNALGTIGGNSRRATPSGALAHVLRLSTFHEHHASIGRRRNFHLVLGYHIARFPVPFPLM